MTKCALTPIAIRSCLEFADGLGARQERAPEQNREPREDTLGRSGCTTTRLPIPSLG